MRWTFLLLALGLLLGVAAPADAGGVAIVQSAGLEPFEKVVQGFQAGLEASVAHRGPRQVQPFLYYRFPVAGSESDVPVLEQVRKAEPELVLAVGTQALEELRDLRGVPIVYALVHTPPAWVAERPEVTGVEMRISPERWVEAIRTAFPDRDRIGLVYDPARTGAFVREARRAVERQGLSLVAREVSSPREVHERLLELRGLIDVLWMLPDLGVITPQTVESMLLFSLRQGVPVITFSEKYLGLGATVAVLLDFESLGAQAGVLARRLLDGTASAPAAPEPPAKLSLRVNQPVARNLGVTVPPSEWNDDDSQR